jgi:hypothetical protein
MFRQTTPSAGFSPAPALLTPPRRSSRISLTQDMRRPDRRQKQGGSSMGMLEDKAISGFSFKASDDSLADLRRRVAMTRWPERETVADATQGVAQAVIDVAKI